jgi:DNA (cytosine-5)-methyltransferase 1
MANEMTVGLTAIDLFCGAGGLSQGFEQAGFQILAANDIDPWAAETFKATHPNAAFLRQPLEELSATDLLRAAGLRRGEVDCLIGGPPCQAFSVYNHQRGFHDSRSHLFREYLRIVDEIRAKWIVMENVPGMRDLGNGRAIKEISRSLGELGYRVENRILKAEEYGIPQERRRIFFIASRTKHAVSWPYPTHGDGLSPVVTVWDAIADLPTLRNGESGSSLPYATSPQTEYQRYLRGAERLVHNHEAPQLAAINLERMTHIPQGGSWRDIPTHLLPAGMKKARRCDHTKRYGRLHPSGLACTVLTKCDLHWGAYIHPFQDRVLTVREAARLQSFSDAVRFLGPRTEQYIQVGNAVPPLLARSIAEAISTVSNGDSRLAAQPKGQLELRTVGL